MKYIQICNCFLIVVSFKNFIGHLIENGPGYSLKVNYKHMVFVLHCWTWQ
jgi:hypothetical protein